MKIQIARIIQTLIITTVLFSCTDVIDVDVPTGDPKLVVEASIDWEKGTSGNQQRITLSTLTPYYSTQEQNEVIGANVVVENLNTGDQFVFTDQNDGDYTTETFIPVLNDEYSLTITYNDVVYMAQEKMTPVTDIVLIDQSIDGGFNSEEIEVNIHFHDPANVDNYYFFKFNRIGDMLPTIEPMSDEFTDGNLMEESFEKEDDEDTDKKEELKPGDLVQYEMYGISERYYNYMQILVNQLGSGGLFNGVPVELKGNCMNASNDKDFTLGYFRLTETIKGVYTVQ